MHRVLVIGVGSIGERHVRTFAATKRVTLGICEALDERRRDVAGRYGIERTHERLEDIAPTHYDAAVIATPAHLHIPMADQLAQAGWHLLIEKPLSISQAGVAELKARLEASGRVTAIGYNLRAHPAVAALRKAIHERRFGRPMQLIFVGGQHFPTFRPAYREVYYRDRAQGGGAIQDGLTHYLNTAEWIVGPTTSVAADATHARLEGVEVEDTVHVIARHGDVLATYSLNQHQAPNETTLSVVCEHGTCQMQFHHSRWRWQSDPAAQWEEERFEGLERDTQYITQAHAFLDAVEGKRQPLCTFAEAEQTLRTQLAILKSADGDSLRAV
jgi:predicted dehydrogenase